MDFNVNKYKVIHMTKINNISFNSYYMNGSQLGVTETEKYLGVQINHKFSWKCHVDVVKKDYYQKLGIVKRVFSKCNNDIKSQLYKQLIRQKLDYCVNERLEPHDTWITACNRTYTDTCSWHCSGSSCGGLYKRFICISLVSSTYETNLSRTVLNVQNY